MAQEDSSRAILERDSSGMPMILSCCAEREPSSRWQSYAGCSNDSVLSSTRTRPVLWTPGKESFAFLGFELCMRKSRRTGNPYSHVQPSRKALKKIKDSVTAMTHRRMTPKPLDEVIGNVNTTLRGWVGYFHYRNCTQAACSLKEACRAADGYSSAQAV